MKASLKRPLGPYPPKYLDLRVWTVHVEAPMDGPRLVTTTRGGQTCRKRSAEASYT